MNVEGDVMIKSLKGTAARKESSTDIIHVLEGFETCGGAALGRHIPRTCRLCMSVHVVSGKTFCRVLEVGVGQITAGDFSSAFCVIVQFGRVHFGSGGHYEDFAR